MPTLTQATTRARVASGAAAAANLLREWRKTGPGNVDVDSLITVLDTAAAAAAPVDWSQMSVPYTLSWTVTGATGTKNMLTGWLYGPLHGPGAAHGVNGTPAFGGLGTDLASLINQL